MELKLLDKEYTPHCEKLWRTVLEMAIKDSLKLQGCNPMEHEKAQKWILNSREDFRLVCDLAGQCPNRIRKNFMKLYNQRIKRENNDI